MRDLGCRIWNVGFGISDFELCTLRCGLCTLKFGIWDLSEDEKAFRINLHVQTSKSKLKSQSTKTKGQRPKSQAPNPKAHSKSLISLNGFSLSEKSGR